MLLLYKNLILLGEVVEAEVALEGLLDIVEFSSDTNRHLGGRV